MNHVSAIKNVFASHYLSVIRQISRQFALGGNAAMKAIQMWDLEWPNIELAYSYAREGLFESPTVLPSDYALAAENLLPIRLGGKAIIEWHRQGFAAARKAKNRTSEIAHLIALGDACDNLGRTREALRYYKRCHRRAEQAGDPRATANALRGLGIAAEELGDVRGCIAFMSKALRHAATLNDLSLRTEILMHIATASSNLRGHRGRVTGTFYMALRLLKRCDPRLRSAVLSNYGKVLEEWGRFPRAIKYYRKALRISRALGDSLGCAHDLYNIAEIHIKRRQDKKAINPLLEAARIAREQGRSDREGQALTLLGRALEHTGEYRRGIECITRGLSLLPRERDRTFDYEVFRPLLSCFEATGDGKALIAVAKRFLKQATRLGDIEDKSEALGYQGLGYRIIGRKAQGIRCTQNALKYARSVNNKDYVSTDLCNLGVLLLEAGQPQKALSLLKKAFAISRRLKDKQRQGWDLCALGTTEHCLGNSRLAVTHLDRALILARGARDVALQGEILYQLGRIYCNSGEMQRSRMVLNRALRLSNADSFLQARINEELARSYLKNGDYRYAMRYFRSSAVLFEKIGNRPGTHRNQAMISRLSKSPMVLRDAFRRSA